MSTAYRSHTAYRADLPYTGVAQAPTVVAAEATLSAQASLEATGTVSTVPVAGGDYRATTAYRASVTYRGDAATPPPATVEAQATLTAQATLEATGSALAPPTVVQAAASFVMSAYVDAQGRVDAGPSWPRPVPLALDVASPWHGGITASIYDAPDGAFIADWSADVSDLRWSFGVHGCRHASGSIPMDAAEAVRTIDHAGPLHLEIALGSRLLWSGRIEQRALTLGKNGGYRFTAYGYWRALGDVPYTALWSDPRVSVWEQGTEPDLETRRPEQFRMDTDNRLYIAPQGGTEFTNTVAGSYVYKAPHNGSRTLSRITFTYELLAPAGSGMHARCVVYREGGSGNAPVILWTLTANGTLQTGTITLAIPADKTWIALDLIGPIGYTYPGTTGDAYLRFTQLDVRTFAGTITGSTIAADVLAKTRAASSDNARQLRASTAHLAPQTLDVPDMVWEDTLPADVLADLAARGDRERQRWEVGVDAHRYLYLRPADTAHRAWNVDIVHTLEVEQVLESLANSVYPVYRDVSGRTLRGATLTDTIATRRQRLVRRRAHKVETTSETYAAQLADVELAEAVAPAPRAGVEIVELYDEHGQPWPLTALRPGDTVTIQNLATSLSTTVDRIRTLRVTECEYAPATDTLSITPEAILPTTDVRRIALSFEPQRPRVRQPR